MTSSSDPAPVPALPGLDKIRAISKVPATRPDHALFCRIRNEDYFLPHFLAHYRRLGIDHFFFADDRSDDGTRELLLAQPDCTVVEADFAFAERFGELQGKNIVARAVPEHIIGPGWTLTVDADEFAVLPKPFSTIRDLTRHLDGKGEISCIASMIDFYPQTLAGRFVDRGLDPFTAFPFFDTGPYFIWEPGKTIPFMLYAGVRHRINEWMLEADRGNVWPVYRPTILQKVPLIKWGHGLFPEKNSHVTNLPPYTGTQIGLAHFKFYPDLDIKIAHAIKTGHYQGESYYYRLLKRFLPAFEHRPLVALVSRRFKGEESLRNNRLIFGNGRQFP